MTYADGYAHGAGGTSAGEIAARLADFVARQTRDVPARLEALRRLIEEKVLDHGLRDGLLGIVRSFRRDVAERRQDRRPTESDWQLLVARIERYGSTSSIEQYSAYLFSVEIPRLDL
jgi:hypothetical protein